MSRFASVLPPSRPTLVGAAVPLALALAAAGLAALGPAERPWAPVLLAAAAGLAAGLALRSGSSAPALSASVAAAPPPSPAASPFEAALEVLPDPLMVVRGGADPDDLGARRIVFANAGARALLRVPREGGLLVAAVRRPEVLEAVDESLYGRAARSTRFDIAGAQDRAWRLWTFPLSAAEAADEDDGPQALLLLRDETDARRSERTRVDFLANASHELRTPLASLSGFIETLRGHARDDAVARDRFLGIMADQAGRMRRLVDDLLSLSRVELNEHLPPTGACDLALAAADISTALQPLAAERDVRIDLHAPAAGEAVAGADRDQMLQVLQNLIDNGLKYAPRGSSLRVEVIGPRAAAEAAATGSTGARARAALLAPDRAEGRRYVAVRVADAGPGVEAQALPRLAERFYRAEGQKSGDRRGTGLGLAIVKHILNRHHGGLVVDSAPGEGATFVAYLPAVEGRTGAAALGAEPPPAAERDGVTKTS